MRLNVAEFLRAASSVAQGQIEGGLEAQQILQQRQQQRQQQQLQQLDFLARQEEGRRSDTLRQLDEASRVGAYIRPSERGDFYGDLYGAAGRVAGAPSAYGAEAFRGIGEPGWQPRSPTNFGALIPAPPAAAAPAPGAGAPVPVPGMGATATPAPSPGGPGVPLLGTGGSAPPPAPPGGPPPPPLAGPLMQSAGAVLGQTAFAPGMGAIAQALSMQGQAAQVRQQAGQQATIQSGGSGGGASVGTGANAVPGPPGVVAPPASIRGVPVPAGPQTATGLPNGVAPEGPEFQSPTGRVFHFTAIDPRQAQQTWNNLQSLLKQGLAYDLDATGRQTMATARTLGGPLPPTDEEGLARLQQATIMAQLALQGRSPGVEMEHGRQAKRNREAVLAPGATPEYLIQVHDQFLAGQKEDPQEYGPDLIGNRPEFQAMVKAVQSGDQARANELADELQRQVRSNMTPEQVQKRFDLLFKAAGQAGVGALQGHDWLRLAQRLGLGEYFTEADAGRMVDLLQGARAETQRDALLKAIPQWAQLPADAQKALVDRIAGLQKVLPKEQRIRVPATWVKDLTPEQAMRLTQGEERLSLEGDRLEIYRAQVQAHRYYQARMRNIQQADPELARLLAKEKFAQRTYHDLATGSDQRKTIAGSYGTWREKNEKDPVAWRLGPSPNATYGEDIRSLWRADQAQQAASKAVEDRLKVTTAGNALQPTSGTASQRPTNGPASVPTAGSTIRLGDGGTLNVAAYRRALYQTPGMTTAEVERRLSAFVQQHGGKAP